MTKAKAQSITADNNKATKVRAQKEAPEQAKAPSKAKKVAAKATRKATGSVEAKEKAATAKSATTKSSAKTKATSTVEAKEQATKAKSTKSTTKAKATSTIEAKEQATKAKPASAKETKAKPATTKSPAKAKATSTVEAKAQATNVKPATTKSTAKAKATSAKASKVEDFNTNSNEDSSTSTITSLGYSYTQEYATAQEVARIASIAKSPSVSIITNTTHTPAGDLSLPESFSIEVEVKPTKKQAPKLLKLNVGNERVHQRGWVNVDFVLCDEALSVADNLRDRSGDDYLFFNSARNRFSLAQFEELYEKVQDEGIARIPALEQLPDQCVSEVHFIFSLEHMASFLTKLNPEQAFFRMMQELHRVCCHGALVEIHALPPLVLREYIDPFRQRVITEGLLRFFDLRWQHNLMRDPRFGPQIANQVLHTGIVFPREGIAFNQVDFPFFALLRTFTEFSAKVKEGISDGSVQSVDLHNLVHNDPSAVSHFAYYLVCTHYYQLDHVFPTDFALVNFDDVRPFALATFNSLKGPTPLAKSLADSGTYQDYVSTVVVFILASLVKQAMMEAYANKHIVESTPMACIGANIGWIPLICAKSHQFCTIDAFEPAPECIKLLEHNVYMADLDRRISIIDKAVTSFDGKADFLVHADNDNCNALSTIQDGVQDDLIVDVKLSDSLDDWILGEDSPKESSADIKPQKIEVNTITLQSFYGKKDLSELPKLVVISTNGHEQSVFDGAWPLFDMGWRPAMVVEFSPLLIATVGKCTYYQDLVQKYHYQCYVLNDHDKSLDLYDLDVMKSMFKRYANPNLNREGISFHLFFAPENLELQGGLVIKNVAPEEVEGSDDNDVIAE